MQEYIDDIELEDWLLDYEYNESEENDFCSLILNNLGMIVGATVGGGVVGFVLGFIRFMTHAGTTIVLFNNIKWTAGIFAGLGFLLSVLFFYVLSSKENLDVSFEVVNDEDTENTFCEDDEDNENEYEVSMLTLWGKTNNKAMNIQPAFNAFLCCTITNIFFIIAIVLVSVMDGVGTYILMCALDWLFDREIWWLGNALIVLVYGFLCVLLYDTISLNKEAWDYFFDGAEYEKENIPPPTLFERFLLIIFSAIFATFALSFI